jgi:hypothetical protein
MANGFTAAGEEALPTTYDGKAITWREPYTLGGELIVPNNSQGNQFPEATFLHNVDKPGEFHRMIIRLTPFDDDAPPAILPPPFIGAVENLDTLLAKYIRLRVRDTAKNENLTKTALLADSLVRRNELIWSFFCPYTMTKSEGFEVSVDSILQDFTITVGATTLTVHNVRVEIAFQGYLIYIASPSEAR